MRCLCAQPRPAPGQALKSYFDTIPKDRLLAVVGQKVSDGRIRALVTAFLEQGVLDGLEEWTPEQGTPQGAVCSPLLSNIYLDPLDHLMAEQSFAMVRYADDLVVVLCQSSQEAAAALAVVQQWTATAGLTLHPAKTRLVDAAEDAFGFLGYRFAAGRRRPRAKSLKKFKDTVRAKTKRTAGHSLSQIIENLNPTLRGWFEYFKHSHRSTFAPLDESAGGCANIARKQHGRSGISRSSDSISWLNAFFAKHGLFNLRDAHAQACRSSCR